MSDLIASESIAESSLEVGQVVAVNILVDTPEGWVQARAQGLVRLHDDVGKVLELQSYPQRVKTPPEPIE